MTRRTFLLAVVPLAALVGCTHEWRVDGAIRGPAEAGPTLTVQALPGATVLLRCAPPSHDGFQARTGPDGTFHLRQSTYDPPWNTCELYVMKDGYRTKRVALEAVCTDKVAERCRSARVDLELERFAAKP